MVRTLFVRYIAVLVFVMGMISCRAKDGNTDAHNAAVSSYVNAGKAHEVKDLSYGQHPHQRADVYFPEGYNDKTPVVFLIHGGGFIAGLKEDFTQQARLFREEDFIVVNISHRLVDTTGLFQYPPVHKKSDVMITDQLKDIHAVVERYKIMAPGWKSSTGNMYMAGHSAGAILSLLYTQGAQNKDKHIKACGNWAGAADFSVPDDKLITNLDQRWKEIFYRAAGAELSVKNNDYMKQLSPYWAAYNNGGMPAISIYPEYNVVLNVPYESEIVLMGTQMLHDLLKERNIKEKLSIYKGDNHVFSKSGSWERLIEETAAFFKQQ